MNKFYCCKGSVNYWFHNLIGVYHFWVISARNSTFFTRSFLARMRARAGMRLPFQVFFETCCPFSPTSKNCQHHPLLGCTMHNWNFPTFILLPSTWLMRWKLFQALSHFPILQTTENWVVVGNEAIHWSASFSGSSPAFQLNGQRVREEPRRKAIINTDNTELSLKFMKVKPTTFEPSVVELYDVNYIIRWFT